MAFKNEIGSPFTNMRAKETIYSFVWGFGQDVSASSRRSKTEEMLTINVSWPTGATFLWD